jgi:hypothetical protein
MCVAGRRKGRRDEFKVDWFVVNDGDSHDYCLVQAGGIQGMAQALWTSRRAVRCTRLTGQGQLRARPAA